MKCRWNDCWITCCHTLFRVLFPLPQIFTTWHLLKNGKCALSKSFVFSLLVCRSISYLATKFYTDDLLAAAINGTAMTDLEPTLCCYFTRHKNKMTLIEYNGPTLNWVIHIDLLLVVNLKKYTSKPSNGMIFVPNTLYSEVLFGRLHEEWSD
jgi:hypothetical protein